MHPYTQLPKHCFWRAAVVQSEEVDPVVTAGFTIRTTDRVATAGSCFAQHIARHLAANGFNYYVAEPAHALMKEGLAAQFNYGVFSARYGNVYTSRQLKQLVQRAYGEFQPAASEWLTDEGWVDPFRPQVQPGGFVSAEELRADRAQHLTAVRTMFESMDVFLFTLGLTECWEDVRDGAVFPLCPGVAGGDFDAAVHRHRVLSVSEVVEDMLWVIDRIRAVNPHCRMAITVSPVPLMATAKPNEHVLVATQHAKAVLRVAAAELMVQRSQVDYFPSFEIITGPHARGRYFADDLRSVTEAGVSHVMRVFLRNYTDTAAASAAPESAKAASSYEREMTQAVKVACEETLLDGEEAL